MTDEYPESEVVQSKLPCPLDGCGSSDAYALYSDGHGHCFSCGGHVHSDRESRPVQRSGKESEADFIPHESRAIKARRLSERICKKFGYGLADHFGKKLQVCDVRNEKGVLLGQKCRGKDKDFFVNGKVPNDVLIGMHLWSGGRRIVITEGEIDYLSYGQATDGKYPVVSLPLGVQSAPKVLKNCMEYLDKFDEVVLWFDNDRAGQEAVEKCLPLFKIGHAKYCYATGHMGEDSQGIAIPCKDANDMLVAGDIKSIVNNVFNAENWKPESLVSMLDIVDDVLTEPVMGMPFWDQRVSDVTFGRQWGQLIMLGAGTGVGKTDWFTQQMAFDLQVLQQPCAAFYLEMPAAELGKRVCGKIAQSVFHVPGECNTGLLASTVKSESLRPDRFQMFDGFGCTDWEAIEQQMRFLVSSGFRIFYIDHLTALATGGDESEKEALERITAEMAEFAQRHRIIIMCISHLATPEKGSHEEGARVQIRHFKGSRSIGFWAHQMFALERDQSKQGSVTTFRSLKDRFTGRSTGFTCALSYEQDRGMLVPCDFPADDNDGFTDSSNEDW